jgi:C_GCAxxG_C_C family probable redox protein
MTKGEIAKLNFQSGLNCAQAVVLAFKEEMGLSELELKKLIIGFGGGFARQRLVCGAVSGMTMVLGYLKSDGNDKLAAYDIVKKACEEVKEQLGSIICSELVSANKIPCGEICKIVADVTAKYVK